MHERMHAWMAGCMHARAGTRHARTSAGPGYAQGWPKIEIPPGNWISGRWPVPWVWRPVFAKRRSEIGQVSERYEAVLSPKSSRQSQWAETRGLDTRFPEKTMWIIGVFGCRSQVRPAGAYGPYANRAGHENTETRRICTHTCAKARHACMGADAWVHACVHTPVA